MTFGLLDFEKKMTKGIDSAIFKHLYFVLKKEIDDFDDKEKEIHIPVSDVNTAT